MRKADFTALYTGADPRGYYRGLAPLAYQIPARAAPAVERVLAASAVGGRERTVLDLCCSYGVNAALLRREPDFDALVSHYCDPGADGLDPAALAARDRDALGRAHHERRVLGLDVSAAAVAYAVEADLLSEGWAADLEQEPADDARSLGDALGDVGLVLCTGGVGYVTERTYGRVLEALDRPEDVWLLTFVLRAYAFDAIAEVAAGYGLLTERVPGPGLRQRRFVDDAEAREATAAVRAQGLDPAGVEDTGWYHACCFVTRPAAAAQETDLADLMAGVPLGAPA